MILLSLLQIGTKKLRPSAIPPRSYTVNGKILFFPKAGGTWFVANADGVILVLLNGADERSMKYNFRIEKTIGLIVLEMISSISKGFLE
jgi:hypothetical protein